MLCILLVGKLCPDLCTHLLDLVKSLTESIRYHRELGYFSRISNMGVWTNP